jgi:hypothetical protein
MTLRNLLAMATVGASLTLTHVNRASAATITWDVSVPVLGGGGSAGGVFSVDTTALSLLSVNISTTADSHLPGSQYAGTAGSSITSTEVTFLDSTSNFLLTLTLNSGSLFVPAASLSLNALEQANCPPDVQCNFRSGDGTISATPLPAALPLFAAGLGSLGLLGWRRKNKAQAAA